MLSNNKLKVMIVDDHQMIIDGIKSILNRTKQYEVAVSANDGEEALEKLNKETIDVLIADINMPKMSGIELSYRVKQIQPKVKILILTMHNSPKIFSGALESGADGIIVKNSGKDELLMALDNLQKGKGFYSQEIFPALIKEENKSHLQPNDLVSLTPREIDVLKLICKEYSNDKIALELSISKHTVESHRKSLFCKTQRKSALGLLKYAQEKKMI